ncbi:MAG: zinc ribbon domain-containing protein [Proteobacteria bacterium]|nr:zinc ribbon domain-containing protein [Pseudomonadota bacterium]MBU1582241.1 zinc ribbon domain-containing protein [Pseudomonadota bacterium]MBU2456045.1 zinc ribbon domain-containing protein [Pseudomonadota bacterium]
MPVYEYQCTKCGQIEEALQKISEPPRETCSHCKGNLKKLISHSAFHLKGSGWYVTDYGGAKTGTETKSDTKIDTKTDTKSNEAKTTPKKAADPKES